MKKFTNSNISKFNPSNIFIISPPINAIEMVELKPETKQTLEEIKMTLCLEQLPEIKPELLPEIPQEPAINYDVIFPNNTDQIPPITDIDIKITPSMQSVVDSVVKSIRKSKKNGWSQK